MKRALTGMLMAGGLACSPGPGTSPDAGPPTTCVARGTWVRTPRGLRRIEELREGDELWSVDPATGQRVATKIVMVRSSTRECVRLSCDELELIVTSDHPLYCPDTRQYAPAGDWALGKRTRLLQIRDEGTAVVEVRSTATFAGMHEVFDLSVDHMLHNFTANDVLVHNKSPLYPPTCHVADAGTFESGDLCSCGSGVMGTVRCVGAQGTCDCSSDGGSDGGADAGSADGGADAGTSDGGP